MGRVVAGWVGLVVFAATGGSSVSGATPDIAGEWETTIQAECADDCAADHQGLTVEIESLAALDAEYDAFALNLESLWGLQGLLEANLRAEVDLPISSMEVVIEPSIALAPPLDDDVRIPPGGPLLVRSRLDTEMAVQGIELTLGIVHDDVNFDDRDAAMPRYDRSDQTFRAGAMVELDGETASDVELSTVNGFCVDPDDRVDLPDGSLSDQVCESGTLNWTRSVFEVDDLPLHPSVDGGGELNCEPIKAPSSLVCELSAELTAESLGMGVQETSVAWDYDTVYPHRALDEIVVELSHASNVEAELTLDDRLQWDELDVDVEQAVHRGDAVLRWAIDGTYERTKGVTDIALEGGLERGPLELNAEAEWDRSNNRLRLEAMSVDGAIQFGAWTLASQFDADADGLDEIELESTLEF